VSVEDLALDFTVPALSLRGDLPARMGFDYKSLSGINPRLVCVHLSAYGRDNERAAWPGYDYLMQAESGLMHLTGEPDGPPSRIGAPSMVDQTTGLTAALALLAGIIQARSSGKGCDMDTCLLDVALHQLGYVASWYLNEGHLSTRQSRSAHFSVAPVQTFPTADGWVFIMCMSDKFWLELLKALDLMPLADDARFATGNSRHHHRRELTAALDPAFRRHTTAEWLARLAGVLPVGPVYDVAQALDSPFVARSGMIQNVPHPEKHDLRVLTSPIKVNGERAELTAAPALGAHNDELLGERAEGAQVRRG